MARVGSGGAGAGPALALGAVAKGTLFSFAVTMLSAVLLGLAVSLTEWEGIDGGLQGFSYVSIALGGMLAGRHGRRLGWFHGALVGLAYYVIASLLFREGFTVAEAASVQWMLGAVMSVVAGALGGILGVNL